MVVLRRRLIFWLIKAYIKKSKKILIFSFLSGLVIFFAVLFGAKYLKGLLTFNRQPVIGIIGSYERDNLPPVVLNRLSKGLTKVEKDASIKNDLADSYTITDNGKTYKFTLLKNQNFNDGTKFESKELVYNFSDVKVERPDQNTIIFKLKDAYAPFLATAAKPVFKKGFVGVGDYTISDIDLNGDFVQNLTLRRKKNRFETIKFIFYPTDEALKTAFALGEVTEVNGVTSTEFKNTSFEKYPQTFVKKEINYETLVALFYNTTDSVLSDRKIRLGLNYAIPDNAGNGKKANLPFPPTSIYFNKEISEREHDLEHAKLLIPDKKLRLRISTLRKYAPVAKRIAKEWEKIGIKTEIEETEQVPDNYQIFLGDFNIPSDPDQYALWHTGQPSNITRYKNLRIDKLLEDGRKTVNISARKKIYEDFQKFILDDMPASFLYFPYEYTVTRN